MAHLELPDGQSAELRDPTKLTEKQRRPAKRLLIHLGELRNDQVPVATETPQPVVDGVGAPEEPKAPEVRVTVDMFDTTDEATRLLAVALVDAWTFPQEVSIDGLDSIPGDAYDVLHAEATAALAHVFPDFAPPKKGESLEGSPTTA